MFDKKQQELVKRKVKEPTVTSSDKKSGKKSKNAFVNASKRASVTTTALGNGAVKVTTTDNDFVDQFAKATAYKAPRSYAEIEKDMRLLWSQDPLKTVQLSLYLRLITRVVQISEGNYTEESQRGQGLKNEGIVRMLWLAINHKETFYKNLPLFIACGSWHDIFAILQYDIEYNGWLNKKLDWYFIGNFIIANLGDPSQSELVKKYLPLIISDTDARSLYKQGRNIIGKYLCSLLFGSKELVFDPEVSANATTYKRYRKLKSGGTAHHWQQLISQKRMNDIDFDTIHGRALNLLVKSKFLKNQGLSEKYTKWIGSKDVAKYTGYAYELMKPLGISYHTTNTLEPHVEDTINKQFMGLIETAKKGMLEISNGLIVVLDVSGSMSSATPATGLSAYSVGKSMALYFSYLLEGVFSDYYLEFSDATVMKEWKGSTPVQRFRNANNGYNGGTNFQSVGDHFVTMLKRGVPLSDFPTGILCISDGCFNPTYYNDGSKSNFHVLKAKLKSGGFPKEYIDNFKVILWDMPNNHYGKTQQAFEDFADTPNLFHISGLDGAAIAFITGTKHETKPVQNSEDLFLAAMNQEVLQLVEI